MRGCNNYVRISNKTHSTAEDLEAHKHLIETMNGDIQNTQDYPDKLIKSILTPTDTEGFILVSK